MSNYQIFLAWLESDCIFDGEYYSSQDAQYSNRLTKKKCTNTLKRIYNQLKQNTTYENS